MSRLVGFVVLVLCLVGASANAGGMTTGRASAIDGDSLKVGGREVRLHGIDAPEWKQLCERGGERYRCGQVAARALAGKIDGHRLDCDVRDVDRYGRAVVVCFLDELDLNAWLVRRGYAVAYRHYSGDYVDEEEAARAAGRGVWAGDFVMPWHWRQGAFPTYQ